MSQLATLGKTEFLEAVGDYLAKREQVTFDRFSLSFGQPRPLGEKP